MLLWLLAAIALAPLYWLAVPARLRPATVTLGSLVGLGLYDWRLVVLMTTVTAGLFVLMRAAARSSGAGAGAIGTLGLVLLGALFVWNKRGGQLAVLPSQGGLVLLGVSYVVLKAAAALIEAARGGLEEFRPADILGWLAFLPTYPSGPMEDLDHFRAQRPVFDRARALGGLERVLVGLVKALVLSSLLGDWAAAIMGDPPAHGRAALLCALYAFALRFYLDFSGYSDVAIGLGALFGYEIEENFDWPLVRRNLVQFWQHWHMTLTRWLRLYLFIPVSRWVMRRAPAGSERVAAAAGQVAAMTVCGLWHGVAWNFAVWGLTQAAGLVWVGVLARDLGRRLPRGMVAWWRRSRVAYGVSTALTFTAFSLSLVFVVADVPHALHYLRLVLGTRV